MSTKREKFAAEGMPLLDKLIKFCLENQIGLKIDLPGKDELIEVKSAIVPVSELAEMLASVIAEAQAAEAEPIAVPKARGIN